jgi:PAS domain S-box-containing protein
VLGEPPLAGMPDEQRHWCMDQLRSGTTVNLPRVAEEVIGGKSSGSTGIKSLLAIPIAANGSACALTFATRESYREWREDLIPRLRLAGEIFASAVLRKKHEEALRESEERYRAFFELTAVGAGQASPDDGHFLRVNEAHCRITGHTRKELLALKFSDITHPEDRDKDLEKFHRLIRGEVTEYTSEKRYLHKRGNPVWVQVDVSLVRDAQGRPLHTVAIVQDINARKRAQEALAQSEAFNRRIIESSNDCMTILDLEGSVLYLNPRGQQLLEIDDLASYRHTSWLDVWQGADKAAATLALQQAKDGGPGAFQGFCATTRGTPKSWDVALAPMRDAEGTVERLLVVSRDISERKKAEALRTGQSRVLEMIATNEPLEDILASLACLMESHAEGMFCSVLLLDDDGLHVRHGAAPSLPESYTKCIDGISIGPQAGSCGTAMYRAEPVIVSDILEDPLWENYRELASAHGLRACWSAPIFSSQGQVLGSFAMYYREPRSPLPAERELIDIATHIAAIAIAHRRAEKALRASEERSRAILRAIPDLMFLMTADGVYLDFHTTNLNELLVQPDHFLGKNMRDVLPPELAEKLAVSFRSALESNEPQSVEYALELKGQEQSYEARIVRTNGDQLLSVVRNITERKAAEEALRFSEERFRQLAENIRAVFFITEVGSGSIPGQILYVSPAYETIWGRSRETLYRHTRSWLEAVHPEDRERLQPAIPNLTKGEFDEEFRIIQPGGKVRWVHGRVFPIRDERGKVYRVAGIVDDITDRKHAEEALRDREERLRLTCEAGRMGVWDWDIAANKVVWSKDIFSILGLEPLSIQPNYGNWTERIHPDDLSRIEEALNAAIRRKGSYQAEYRIIWPDGTIRWTEGRGRSTYNEAGDCISMQGLMIDITERKQAEEALRESEERYRNVVETQTELICRNLPDTTLTFVNDAYCRYFNRTREELIGTKFLELIPEAVHLAVLRHVEALMESRSPDTSEHEHEVIRADGSVGWQQWVNRKIFDPAGRVIEVQGIGRDITERKLAENALRESEERYRNVVETQTELICRYECDTTLTFVNDAYCRYFGKTREQLIGTKFLELMPEEARPAAVTHVESLIANPRIETDEHEVIRADGTIGWQQWVDYAIRDADGTIIEMQAIGRDITERKRLEEDLQGREREFATLVENSPDIISRLDRDLRFLYVSPIVERVLGVPPQHFIGKTTREVGTPPHDWDAFESSCRQAFETGEIVDREFSYGGRHYHSRLIPEFGTGSSVDSVMCISEDTTERRRAEQELVQMSGRLLGLQEEERRRIARQLHDVTAQNLFATTINLARLQSPAVSSEVKEVLAECQGLCEQALQEIRTLSYILHPPILDQAGLVSALRWYIDGFSKRSGIDVGLVVTREFDRLPREVEADLFRIVQESLANVHRHSGSITARVRLEKQATQVVVQIRDEGHGMQRAKTRLEADESTLGVGIPGMRHRLRQLGGNLTIESNSHGTTVMATVPLRVERRERSRASHGSG